MATAKEYQALIDSLSGECERLHKALNDIRAEIEKVFCMSVVTNELGTPMEVKTEILQIIDKYR